MASSSRRDGHAANPATTGPGAGCAARIERALRTLSAGNRTLLRAGGEAQLLQDMCRVVVEHGGYRMAWVGYAEHDDRCTIRPMAHAGFEAGYLESVELTWAERAFGHGPTGIAIRTGHYRVMQDIRGQADLPDLSQARAESQLRGYASLVAFPLRVDDTVIGNLTIFADEPDAFDNAELALLEELADDLSFGIRTLRARERQQEVERLIERMAYVDPLTGLPNRTRLMAHLAEAIDDARQQHRSFGLLMLNVDRFREINEVIGFHQGDRLLAALGERLSAQLAPPQLLARVGVDEFAALLPGADAESATQQAQCLLKSLDEPFDLQDTRLEVRASIGVALFPGHGTDADLLLLRADRAMYAAKRSRSGVEVFRGDSEQESQQRLALIGDLRRAIDEDQLRLYCQPKADLRAGTVCGAEALVRWHHPEQGLISPIRFVPLAERTGLIHALTYWVLNAALSQCYAWRERGLSVPLAVNLSARNLQDPRLLDRVAGLLTTWGAAPDWVQFELTESALMEDPVGALGALQRLSEMGFRLYVDDFGTGYSSLSYLQRLPIDAVKIDQSFVRDMLGQADSRVIVHSTIDMAHNIGLEVVAEGTETQEIWNQLAALGADVAQGNYISEPMPADELIGWSQTSAWRVAATMSPL